MRQRKNYAAIDNFRLVAALLIVAIHTAPLASFSETADFLVTYCFGRVGVPFFLMVSGFFVLAPYQRKMQPARRKLSHRQSAGDAAGISDYGAAVFLQPACSVSNCICVVCPGCVRRQLLQFNQSGSFFEIGV